MSRLAHTLFRDEERVKTTLSLGAVACGFVALALTIAVYIWR